MATHYSTLAWKIPWMDRGAWQATVYGVSKSWTRLRTKRLHFHFHFSFLWAKYLGMEWLDYVVGLCLTF